MQSLGSAPQRRNPNDKHRSRPRILRRNAQWSDCIWVDCTPIRVRSSQIIWDATQTTPQVAVAGPQGLEKFLPERPPSYLLPLKKSVIADFCRQKVGRSRFRVRHDAGVFRPNRRHQRNANGEKTLKPVSFGLSGQKLKIFVGKKLNQRPAKCAIHARP